MKKSEKKSPTEKSEKGARPLETGDVLRGAAVVLEHEPAASAPSRGEPALPSRGEPPAWAREGARSVVSDVHAGVGPDDSGVGAALHEALASYLDARADGRAAAARDLARDLGWLLADVYEAWGEERPAPAPAPAPDADRMRALVACVRAQAALLAMPARRS